MVESRFLKVLLVVGLLVVSLFPANPVAANTEEPMYDPTTDVVAKRTSTPPTIDGTMDTVWQSATALDAFATGNNGNFDIFIRAMFDDDYIYILAQWDEQTQGGTVTPKADLDRDAWELTSNSTPGTWDHKDWGEDRLSFLFDDPDNPVENFTAQGCDAVCHGANLDQMYTKNPGEVLDAWVWSSATTDDQGFADDGYLTEQGTVTIDPSTMHVEKSDLAWDPGTASWLVNNDTQSASLRPTHVWKDGATPANPSYMYDTDAQQVDWGTFDIADIEQGSFVPGHVLGTPSGDRAHIEAKGTHDGTKWTVEFKRARDTSSANDVAFTKANVPYYFGPSVTDNRTGADHSKGVSPFRLWLAEPELPDLSPRIPPLAEEVTVNSTFDATIFVDNRGWTDASPTRFAYYWDDDTTPEGYADVPAVQWGKYASVDVEWNSTDLAAGLHTLRVVADIDTTITEISETNNEATLEVELGAEPLPDLVVEALEFYPTTAPQRSSVQVNVTVANRGTLASPAARLFITLDDVPSDPIYDNVVGPYGIDGSEVVILTWPLDDIPVGTHTVNATLDLLDVIKELNETNNTLTAPFEVTEPTFPDLIVESVVPVATTVEQGSRTFVNVTVKNVGGATVEGGFELALFFNEAFTGGTAVPVATCATADDLPVGANWTVTMRYDVPMDAVGSVFIRAHVDWMGSIEELDESNNNGTYDGLVVTPRRLPDLVVLSVSPEDAVRKLETRINFTITVKNEGKDASLTTSLEIKDETKDNTVTYLTVPELAVNATAVLYYDWLLRDLKVGDVTVAFIVDNHNQIEEENELNNVLRTIMTVQPADLPDLMLEDGGITFTPAEPRLGDDVTVTVTVKNAGTAPSGNFSLEVKLGNKVQPKENIPSLDVDESRELFVVWTSANFVSAMNYRIVVLLDSDSRVRELNESNNEYNATVTYVEPPEALLLNLTITASRETIKDGEQVAFMVSLENIGDAAASVAFVLYEGGVEVAPKEDVIVSAGGKKTAEFNVTVKGTGEHTYTVKVMKGSEVLKDDEGNDLVLSATIKVEKKKKDGPGPGAIAAAVALLGVAFITLRRRRRGR